MMVIALLILASLVMAGTFLALFFIAVRHGQFDDLESPGFRILKDKKDKIKS
jgi:cbb3-type cytochrome oxidase maturation protein